MVFFVPLRRMQLRELLEEDYIQQKLYKALIQELNSVHREIAKRYGAGLKAGDCNTEYYIVFILLEISK